MDYDHDPIGDIRHAYESGAATITLKRGQMLTLLRYREAIINAKNDTIRENWKLKSLLSKEET